LDIGFFEYALFQFGHIGQNLFTKYSGFGFLKFWQKA